jgi:isopentenyl-diphosphate Delta-isomerase
MKQALEFEDIDPTTESRKSDHIELAFKSQIASSELDRRFYYEPMLNGHPGVDEEWPEFTFLGKTLKLPLWVSSMTGGTQMAGIINRNLARACAEFGMGMGLGSCRSLLSSDEHLNDFLLRPIIGDNLPLYANLGIAQVELLLSENKVYLIENLIEKLQADGLIIHVNPLQEWLQPEGDRIINSPVHTIEKLLELFQFPVIVKEVGQGFGPASMEALLRLPLAAIDFASNGGTNFAQLELLRGHTDAQDAYSPLGKTGHSAAEMLDFLNTIVKDQAVKTPHIIISGGIKSFLDGFWMINRSSLPAIYGQASGFLKYAMNDYASLRSYVSLQKEGLKLARKFLVPRPYIQI